MSKKRKLRTDVSGWAPYLLIFLPAALAFLYVHSFGVNVLYGDEWSIARLFQELYSGTLGVGDLWALHGDHRILFPRLAMLGLGLVTSFNSVAEMYLTLACFLLTLLGLLLVFRSDVAKGSWSLLLFVPVAFLVFSFRQYENMLSGFQVAFGMVQASSVLALCLLYFSKHERLRKYAFPAALASATVGSFSAAQGLFAWPVGLFQLLVGPIEGRAKRVMAGVWGSVGLAEWAVYFIGFERSGGSSLGYALHNPADGVEYFLTLLGGSLFWQQTLAFFGGLLLVCLAVASLFSLIRARKLGEHWFWVALLCFSFLMLVSIALGRSDYGTLQALSSKYTSFSALAVVGAYAILVKLVLERRSYLTVASLGLLSALILLSVPWHYYEGVEQGKTIEAKRERMAFVLATYESQPDGAFQEVHRNPNRVDRIRRQARFLDGLDYNVFSDQKRDTASADMERAVAYAMLESKENSGSTVGGGR